MSERWFVLEGRQEDLAVLTENRIPAAEVRLKTPVESRGVSFPEEDLPKVLSLLGINKEYDQVETDQEGVYLLQEKVPVIFDADDNWQPVEGGRIGRNSLRSWITSSLEKYTTLMGCSVYIDSCNGATVEPSEGSDNVVIHCFATPIADPEEHKYESAFGVSLADQGRSKGYLFSGMGNPIADAEGSIVAEVVGNEIYVLFDVLKNWDYYRPQEQLEVIMKQFFILQFDDGQSPEARIEDLGAYLDAISRETYIRECAKRVDRMLREATSEIETGEAELAKISTRIVELTRSLSVSKVQRDALSNNGDEMKARFEMEYDKLYENPMVIEVKAEKGLISVTTDTIFIEYKDRIYELGDYRVDLYTNGTIKITNLRQSEVTSQDCPHPHVASGGTPCFGNVTEGIAKLVGDYQYALVVHMVVSFLGTYNPGSPHAELDEYWQPVGDDKGGAESEEATAEAVETEAVVA